MFVKCLLLIVLTSEVKSLYLQEIDAEWDLFKVKFNKTYSTWMEEKYRYQVFIESLQQVYLHNTAADKGRYTYWLRINRFADMTSEEFNDIFAGLKIKPRHSKKENKLKLKYQTKLRYNLTDIPEAVDWRDEDCVTPVKYQGNCRSCYAFAATGALEGLYCKENEKLESLSEQNILDCSLTFGNDGCVNGNPENAFKYVNKKGIDTETSYPYKGAISLSGRDAVVDKLYTMYSQTCKQRPLSGSYKCGLYVQIGECEIPDGVLGMWPNGYKPVYPRGIESLLQKNVAERPVSVCIDTKGEGDKFKLYGHGVYDNSECGENREDLTHAMLAVGYDTTEDGVDYWIIKNSYGTCWGMDGYLWMIRNKDNRCGIATLASYPTEWDD